MPLGKYYCDYCEKEFQDTASARKRHLQSLHHHRAKALWYDSFKDPHQALTDGFGKQLCNRFLRTGFCQYGDSCIYFHPNNNPLNPRRAQELAGFDYSQNRNTTGNPSIGGASSLPCNAVRDGTGMGMRMEMPWGNLPPSLKPPLENGYPSLPFLDWG